MSLLTNNIIKSVTLKPGETFTLPPGATIVASTGAVSSPCGVPDVSELKCYQIKWAVDDDSGQNPWDSEDVIFHGMYFGNQFYPFITPVVGAADQEAAVAGAIRNSFSMMIDVGNENIDQDSERIDKRVVFKTLPAIGDALWLVAGAQGFGGADKKNVYLKAEEIAC